MMAKRIAREVFPSSDAILLNRKGCKTAEFRLEASAGKTPTSSNLSQAIDALEKGAFLALFKEYPHTRHPDTVPRAKLAVPHLEHSIIMNPLELFPIKFLLDCATHPLRTAQFM
ncbi:MAG: hypothetical protein ACLFSB_05515 [Chitinispirillaceae bacterium]